ncbi:MAG: hypothetical protein JEZ11_19830 [Desulfobacterales bacterium]|nr:hypothetical protein [Desulfobacterales bacterium]
MKPEMLPNNRQTGIVIPSNWDERGNVLELTLQTDSDEEYLLEGINLDKYIQSRVEVFGSIAQYDGGRKRMRVHQLAVIKGYAGR